MASNHSRSSLSLQHTFEKGSRLNDIRKYLGPAIMLIAWITVLSYTVSMVATIEPALRQIGHNADSARVPLGGI